MTQRIEFNEEMVGNAHPTKTDTLNRFINLITAAGDLLYGTATATATKLTKGAANTKLFMNAGDTAPEWAKGLSIISGIRDPDTVGGTQAFTGAGFKPSLVIALLASNGGTKEYWSAGVYDGVSSHCIAGIQTGITLGTTTNLMIASETWGVTMNDAVGTSLDTDGLTVTWTRTGVPTGPADEIRMSFICLR